MRQGQNQGRGLYENADPARLPLPRPTSIPPGPAKVAVLAERALAGLALWHPDDATFATTTTERLLPVQATAAPPTADPRPRKERNE